MPVWQSLQQSRASDLGPVALDACGHPHVVLSNMSFEPGLLNKMVLRCGFLGLELEQFSFGVS